MTDPTPARQLLRHAYQELAVCGVVWIVAMIWTLGVYVLIGYRHAPDHWLVTSGWARSPDAPVPIVLGMPEWVAYGVVLPWVTISIFTVLYALFWMHDDDLGDDPEETADAV